MEKPNESLTILNMFTHPVFLVADGTIAVANEAAAAKGLTAGIAVCDILEDTLQEYEAFNSGYLSLTVKKDDIRYLATVIPSESGHAFHLHSSTMGSEFRTMALISQQLRGPLSGIMTAAEMLLPLAVDSGNPNNISQAAQMNRNLHQLLREVSNLSAVQQITDGRCYRQVHNITALIDEIMENAKVYTQRSNRTLEFTSLHEDIQCLSDNDLIERALYNLISNAVKFSPEQSTVSAKLIRSGNKLRFSISNAITPDADRNNLFTRFMREPGIEDGRYGIGLGLPLIQHAAASHGGSLLMDLPEENTVRFTMTLPIRQNTEGVFRTPVITFDYLGGYNHALVELSDILSDELYYQ